jgi:undecaprenyl-diphosphatase
VDVLNHYLQIILLGIVEGVTEFLPISSTGHLLIAEHFLGTQEPDIFNVVIQAGAILAVVFIYWKKIVALIVHIDREEARAYLLKIGLAFIVTSVLYLVVAKLVGHHKITESLSNVAWATLIGGLVIFLIEFLAKNLYSHGDVSWFEAVLVGAAQVLAALFPGTSRSGATIMSGLAVGMKRPAVTEFSFLVGIPTMFAASAYATWKGREDLHGIGQQLIIDTAIGFVVSGIVAFFVVKWLLYFVQSHTFNGFATYRVILGVALLIGLYTHAIPDVTDEPAEKKTLLPSATPLVAPSPDSTNAPAAPMVTPDTNAPSTNAPASAITSPGAPGAISPVSPASAFSPQSSSVFVPPVTNSAPAHVPAP